MTNTKFALMAIPFLLAIMVLGTSTLAFAGIGDVEIDIKPGSDPNSVNPNSRGVIPVAILGSETLDVTEVDPTTITFMAADDTAGTNSPVGFGFEDVNDDGYLDLVAHFLTQGTWISCITTQGALSATLVDGNLIFGFDSINPVPCRD